MGKRVDGVLAYQNGKVISGVSVDDCVESSVEW